MIKIKYSGYLALFFLSCSVSAATPPAAPAKLKNMEISAAGGPAWIYTNNTKIIMSPSETDSVQVNQTSSGGTANLYQKKFNGSLWKIGVGYHFFAEKLKNRTVLNDLLVELNLYGSSTTINGNVWQFQNAALNNFSFGAPITSTRLMLDVKPLLFNLDPFEIYPILGIGAAWNTISFQEVVIAGSGVVPTSFNKNTNTNFAYDLGTGVRIGLTTHLTAALEYLYTNLGSISPTNAGVVSPPTFKVDSQSLLLGLNWKFN